MTSTAQSAHEAHPGCPPSPGHPVVVVGAGPAGLAAAAQAHARGIPTVVLEAGTGAGSAVLEWGHVRLFSPWSELIDPVAEKLLTGAAGPAPTRRRTRPDASGWRPTSRHWPRCSPTARRRDPVRPPRRRRRPSGRDRLVAVGRDEVPFTVHVATPEAARA